MLSIKVALGTCAPHILQLESRWDPLIDTQRHYLMTTFDHQVLFVSGACVVVWGRPLILYIDLQPASAAHITW